MHSLCTATCSNKSFKKSEIENIQTESCIYSNKISREKAQRKVRGNKFSDLNIGKQFSDLKR